MTRHQLLRSRPPTRSLVLSLIVAILALLLPALALWPAAAQGDSEPRNVRFALPEANGSGVEARIKLIDLDGQTRIVISLRGEVAGEYLPHIHTGSCESYPGEPTWPLALFAAGDRSRTTVDVPYDDLLSGEYLVDIHPVLTSVEALFDPATALVCGQLTEQRETPEPTPTPEPEIAVIRGPNTGMGPFPDQYSSTILALGLSVIGVAAACFGFDLRRRTVLTIAQRRLVRLTGRQL